MVRKSLNGNDSTAEDIGLQRLGKSVKTSVKTHKTGRQTDRSVTAAGANQLGPMDGIRLAQKSGDLGSFSGGYNRPHRAK